MSEGTLSSMETYIVIPASANSRKVVLETKEKLQLSVHDNLSQNGSVMRASSNSAVTTINENYMATALATGNATITVSDGGSYTETINILLVENADCYRLAIDLHVGDTRLLTTDDYTNTKIIICTSSNPP